MYYPYLRGRQFELIALREYAQQHGVINNIIPIIEPVRNTFNSMKLAIPIIIAQRIKFALILNPQVGEINKAHEILDSLNIVLGDQSNWIPAFILNNNYKQVTSLISEFGLSNVMLICKESIDSSNPDFELLAFAENVKYIVSEENRVLKRKLIGRGKQLIRLDDNFNAQKRNSDYLSMPDEKFSEEHIFYSEDGYQGFSDYSVVVSDFVEGGAAPFAVAIHLTYEKEDKEVWIRHFVSDTNDDRSNIQGKFAEAASKAVNFLNAENIHSYASEELRNYYNNKTYPGLGMIKKISIKNHLELINRLLVG